MLMHVRSMTSLLASMVTAVLVTACANADHLVRFEKLAGRTRITADALVNAMPCIGAVQGGTITATCTLADAGTPGSRTATIAVTGLSSGDTLQLIPFAVFQLPADAANFAGTY